MAEARFYTYVHRKADTGVVFYVGKGSGRRAYIQRKRNPYWNYVVAKHGLVVEILAYFYENQCALDYEREVIAGLKSEGVQLANLTDGGEGTIGWHHDDGVKEKIRVLATGRNPSAAARERMSAAGKTKVFTLEHRLKLSLAGAARFADPKVRAASGESQKGKAFSDETRKRISEKGLGRVVTPATREKIRTAHLARFQAARMTKTETQIEMAFA
jgi:hypothetical protein